MVITFTLNCLNLLQKTSEEQNMNQFYSKSGSNQDISDRIECLCEHKQESVSFIELRVGNDVKNLDLTVMKRVEGKSNNSAPC